MCGNSVGELCLEFGLGSVPGAVLGVGIAFVP